MTTNNTMDPKQLAAPVTEEQLAQGNGFRVTVFSDFDGMLNHHHLLLSHAREMAGQNPSRILVVLCYKDYAGGQVASGRRILLSPEERARLLSDMGYQHILPWSFSQGTQQQAPPEWPVNPELLKDKGGRLVPGADLWSKRSFRKLFNETTKSDQHFREQTDQTFSETDPESRKHHKLIGLIETGELTEAAHEMGFAYPLSGHVVEGNKIGRTLGYPTANLRLTDYSKVLPGQGAYAGMVLVAGNWHHSMINIGIRPTIDAENVTIEAHLFNFRNEIYGEFATIAFLARIRDEMRFSSLADLKHQLDKDRHQAANILHYLAPENTDKGFIFMQNRIRWS
ncbi:MAG: riboflavin kinase [Bacteroidales bacterium]